MDNYRALFKAKTDTFKANYCTQVDNYFDLVLSQIEAITSRTGYESAQELSRMMNHMEDTNTFYQKQLDWLSRRYFDNKPAFDAISSAINGTTSFTNPITLSHPNTRDSNQVNALSEYSTNQPQKATISKRSDAIVGMPKYSSGGLLGLDSTLFDNPFVSVSPSDHKIGSQTLPSVSRKAPNEKSPKFVSVGQLDDENDTDTTLSEVHQWESELDPNCDCKDCQPDKIQIHAESDSSPMIAFESDNSNGSVATSPNGSNGHRPRVIKSEFAFERQFEFNLAQLTSDTESDKVDSSSGGQVNETKEAKLIEVKARVQEPPEQAPLGAFKRALASPVSTGSTDGKRARGVQVKKGHTCATCGRSFVKKSNFDRHLLTHSQERPFVCDQCGKSFNRRDNLTVHLLSHSGTMKFRCTWPGCAYQAIISSNMVLHIRGVHFKLPASKTKQLQLGIVDHRDPHEYLEKL